MTHQEFIERLKANQIELYSNEVNGRTIFNADFLTVILNKLIAINYQDWALHGHIQSHLDIRFQLFVKIEMATVHYYQSILSTIYGIDAIWEGTKELGYLNQFTMNTITYREVSLRTAYLEKVFFEIDYFIQRMNNHVKFHQTGSTHNKQKYFELLMEKLEIADAVINTSELVEDLNGNCSVKYMKNTFVNVKSRDIKMSEVYSYLVSIRNTLHNNGYSQKTLNKLDMGGVVIDIQKNKQVNQSHPVVSTLVFMVLYPLLKIVEKTFINYPKQYWEDPYTKELNDFVSEREKQRGSIGKKGSSI